MKYIVGVISILAVIIICITICNVFNKKEGFENVQDQYLLNQEKYYEGRLSGSALPGQNVRIVKILYIFYISIFEMIHNGLLTE